MIAQRLDVIEAVIRIIAEHPLYYDDIRDEYRCKCGWEPDDEALDYTEYARVPAHEGLDRQHAAHVVAAIRDSGLTVIALPEADGPDEEGQLWFDDFDIRVDTTGINTRLYVNGEPRTPDAVYQHAVALIAAAQVAERNIP